MFVSRSDVSWRDSIQRDSCVTGAKAIASSEAGSGAPASSDRTNRSRDTGCATPGSIGFQSVAGASVAAIATFRGPVRRSRYGAIDCPPRAGRLLPLRGRHRDLHQLFRLGECRRRDVGAGAGAGAESGRRSWCRGRATGSPAGRRLVGRRRSRRETPGVRGSGTGGVCSFGAIVAQRLRLANGAGRRYSVCLPCTTSLRQLEL